MCVGCCCPREILFNQRPKFSLSVLIYPIITAGCFAMSNVLARWAFHNLYCFFLTKCCPDFFFHSFVKWKQESKQNVPNPLRAKHCRWVLSSPNEYLLVRCIMSFEADDYWYSYWRIAGFYIINTYQKLEQIVMLDMVSQWLSYLWPEFLFQWHICKAHHR